MRGKLERERKSEGFGGPTLPYELPRCWGLALAGKVCKSTNQNRATPNRISCVAS